MLGMFHHLRMCWSMIYITVHLGVNRCLLVPTRDKTPLFWVLLNSLGNVISQNVICKSLFGTEHGKLRRVKLSLLQANGKYLWSTVTVLAAQCTEVEVDANYIRTDRVFLQEDVFGINVPASFFSNKFIINYCDIVKEAVVLVRCMWVYVKRAHP